MIFKDIFPLRPGTKKPAVQWATPAPYVIAEGEAYGVPTGARNGVWVLDLDRHEGAPDGLASLSAYCSDNGVELPDTYTVRTPSGGLHLYWTDVQGIRNRQGILPGVDVRGDGGYVCAGGPYRVELDVPVAPAPEWLVDLVTAGKDDEPAPNPVISIGPEHPDWNYRLEAARAFLAMEPPCVSGQGGQKQLWRIALRMSRTFELPPSTSATMFEAYNAMCVPPWSVGEYHRAFVRAAEYGTGPTGMAPESWTVPSIPKSAGQSPSEGRRKKDTAWEYSFDMARDIQRCAVAANPCPQAILAGTFTGPAASEHWAGVWQYDMFRRRIVAVNPPMRLDAETVGLTTADLGAMQMWCAMMGMKVNVDQIRMAIEVAAHAAQFHPIRDYLAALPPCSHESADAYFRDIAGRLWGASDENESGHLRRMAIAAVRRVKVPGTKHDTMLVLSGEQGWNKSRFCAKLFAEFFNDNMPDLASKDASIALDGMWGIELPELTALTRSQGEVKKAFLSRSEDKYRPPYERSTLVQPRQCVFIGTTNETEFLDDPTGARRYDVCVMRREIDISFDRDEFWSAASTLESAGESHHRSGISTTADNVAYQISDAWAEDTEKFLKDKATAGVEWITAHDALTYGVMVPLAQQTPVHVKRIAGTLRRLCGGSVPRRVDGHVRRYYATAKKASVEP